MGPLIIEVSVVIICACTASYFLVQTVRWIIRLLKSRNEHSDRQEGPPDLFGGF
jgi:hypothetical protein